MTSPTVRVSVALLQLCASSFFNLFNYDHGLLNEHRDRCLVTVTYCRPSQQRGASALWVQRRDGQWFSSDQVLEEREILLLVGEEIEAAAREASLNLWAAPHAVRVDPTGAPIERAHHRRDPATPVQGNRKSAALILSHPLEIASGSQGRN